MEQSSSSSSFTNLPYETLRDIILYDSVFTMEPEESDEPLLHFHVVSPPIVASQVCRSWRQALLSDPTMWTCISIPEMKPNCVMELLRRSDTSLVNVFIKLKNDRRLCCDGTLSTLTAVLLEIHRFKVLHMQVDPTISWRPLIESDILVGMINRALSHIRRPAPKLETFFVWYSGSLTSANETNLLKNLFSKKAPNLKNVHHRLSGDMVEIGCSAFHNLTELHISLLGDNPVDAGGFLNLLRASPRLKLLRVHNSWDWYRGISILKRSPRQRVQLPHLQILVLEVNYVTILLDLIFKSVTLPSSYKWQIVARYTPGVSRMLRYTRRVPFTSLHIEMTDVLALSFRERSVPDYFNHFNHNKLVCRYEDFIDLMDSWDQLKELLESLNITHLSLEVDPPYYISPEELFDFSVYRAIIGPLSSNLESLTVMYKMGEDDDDDGSEKKEEKSSKSKDDSSLFYLTEFMPNLGATLASEYNSITMTPDMDILNPNAIQDPDLDLVPADSEDCDFINDQLVTSTGAFSFPYLHLQELHVKIRGALKEIDAVMLCTCALARRNEGYPLRIFVRCAEVRENARSLIRQDTDIYVLVNPAAG